MHAIKPGSDDLAGRLTAAILENAPTTGATEPHLRAAITAAASAPGRLIRAKLVHTALRTHGLDDEAACQIACAVEYYHLASLILDDLPCMDDAATRRGEPCVHRVHGDATAILASLAFINRAYALIGFTLAAQPPGVRLQAQACLDSCLGAGGIIGGQANDLRFAESDRSAREVMLIAARKTGSLFWLAVFFPALIARPTASEQHWLKALCLYWGLAYQAQDDLRDVLATEIEAGKTTGRDRSLARPNLALVLGVAGARLRLARLIAQAERALGKLGAQRECWAYLSQFQDKYFKPLAALDKIAAA